MKDSFRFTVEPDETGERLDKYLVGKQLGSRSAIQRWIADERVNVDGTIATAKTKVRSGSVVEGSPAPEPPSEALPQDLPIQIVFEDDDLLVIDKAAGMVVHPGAGHPDGTLVNALLHHTRFEDGGDPMRPGIVHRLDKDTSGVMVVAKTVAAREGLVALFQKHDIQRRYEAIAVGAIRSQTFDTNHGRHPVHRKRFSSKVNSGKRAVTHLKIRERVHGAVFADCTLETGRTHQIRVHLADAGAAVLGDPIYGKRPHDPRLKEAAEVIGRLALHAAVLGFVHPVTGRAMRFEVQLPAAFTAALDLLRHTQTR